MSEHRKSLEKGNAFADLLEIQRRLTRRAKGPEFKRNDQRKDRLGIGKRLLTPNNVWKFQQSLHAQSMKACPKAGCGKFAPERLRD